MPTLPSGDVEIIDLTAQLSSSTPIIQLPEPFVNTPGFSLTELSRYDDDRGFWYWNAIETGEHVGTHVDAPNHWNTGRDLIGVDEIPLEHLIAPAVVIDKSAETEENPDFLLEVSHIEEWQSEHGSVPEGGWLLYRTGWDARSDDQERFLNADEDGPHTPGVSPECAEWLANTAPIVGMGVETVGTDAGSAGGMNPPFPCHSYLLGAGKYGLTQLQNLARLPAVGTTLVVAPLPIVDGSGSPARVFGLVP